MHLTIQTLKAVTSRKTNIEDPAICVSVRYLVGDKEKVKIAYPHIALEDE
jgi:hypothetical protein